jgi:PAS domain S-box-containing protein
MRLVSETADRPPTDSSVAETLVLAPSRAGESETAPSVLVQLRRRERQQALVAELGRSALMGTQLPELVTQALAAVAGGLAVDRVALLEPTGDGLLACRAAIGWAPSEQTQVAVDSESQVAETFRSRQPQVVIDLDEDSRFPASRHLVCLGLRSSASVPIRGEADPVGILVAHSRREGVFGEDEVVFLRAVANILAIVDARERADRRRRLSESGVALLAEAGQLLASSLDYDSTLGALASLIVPRLADWFIVDLVEADGTFRRVAVGAARRDKQELLEQLSREFVASVDGPSPASRALSRAATVHFPSFTPESLRATTVDDRHFDILSQLEPRSAIAVPLLTGGEVIGALTFAWSESARSYDEDDVRLAEEVARRAASAIENARLYRRERSARSMAEHLMRRLARVVRQAEERAEAAGALETVAEGVLLVDRSGLIRIWNAAAESITGLSRAEVRESAVTDVIEGWDEVAARVPVADPEGLSSVTRRTLPVIVSGRELWLSIAAVPAAGGVAYTFRDVTADRLLDRMKSEFVATVSHELRTPLTVVYGSATTLAQPNLAEDADLREQLIDQIVTHSKRLMAIIDDILLAGAIDAERVRLQPQLVDPFETTRAAIDSALARRQGGGEIVLTAGDPIDEIEVDGSRLRQILDNLIDNAIKYSPAGAPVEIRVEAGESRIAFHVSDHGLGIPPGELERIFEKFYRLDPGQVRGVGGTGLGLFVCRELARRMGGQLVVDSTPGVGSTFTLELPRR